MFLNTFRDCQVESVCDQLAAAILEQLFEVITELFSSRH